MGTGGDTYEVYKIPPFEKENLPNKRFEQLLTGGHPNSLGRTLEVVDAVLANPQKLEELYDCYFSTDEIVRLRVSNAIKRISREKPEWLVPYIDGFIKDISKIDQPSVQWTLANLFGTLSLNPAQLKEAKNILKHNLTAFNDWIVLNNTMETLANWSKDDPKLREWLIPRLTRLGFDKRKSVSTRAKKLIACFKTG